MVEKAGFDPFANPPANARFQREPAASADWVLTRDRQARGRRSAIRALSNSGWRR
jgi:hypothetical protein